MPGGSRHGSGPSFDSLAATREHWVARLMQAAGVRTRLSLSGKMMLCAIEKHQYTIEFIPHRHDGLRRCGRQEDRDWRRCGILVIDMLEQELTKRTQQAVIAHLSRRGPDARPLFMLTRSLAILDLARWAPMRR